MQLPIDKIAALGGVCRTIVQTTFHEARRFCHLKITERPIPGGKHLANVVEIVSFLKFIFMPRLVTATPRLQEILLHHLPDVSSAAVRDDASGIKRHPDCRLHSRSKINPSRLDSA